jgi:hypothetical protein
VVDLVGHTVQLLDFRFFRGSQSPCCMIAAGGRGECAE